MEQTERSQIQQLYEQGDWRGIVSWLSSSTYTLGGSLLWLRPDEETLHWLSDTLRQLNVHHVISIGCGTGLLEWLLAEVSGLKVLGVELDRAWWMSRHSLGPYAPLIFAGEVSSPFDDNSEKSALLFCYFNDGQAFQSYMKHFKGRVCVVAGPGPLSANIHTDPEPFSAGTQRILNGWRLEYSKQVAQTLDWIAIYTRNE